MPTKPQSSSSSPTTKPTKPQLVNTRSVTLSVDNQRQQNDFLPPTSPPPSMAIATAANGVNFSRSTSSTTRKFDPQFLIVKYLFMLLNVIELIAASLLLYNTRWTPDNSLVILGLIFGLILSCMALLGSFKEECYLVLTYSIAITSCFLATLFYAHNWQQELIIFVYALFSFYFSYLLYNKTRPTPLISLSTI